MRTEFGTACHCGCREFEISTTRLPASRGTAHGGEGSLTRRGYRGILGEIIDREFERRCTTAESHRAPVGFNCRSRALPQHVLCWREIKGTTRPVKQIARLCDSSGDRPQVGGTPTDPHLLCRMRGFAGAGRHQCRPQRRSRLVVESPSRAESSGPVGRHLARCRGSGTRGSRIPPRGKRPFG